MSERRPVRQVKRTKFADEVIEYDSKLTKRLTRNQILQIEKVEEEEEEERRGVERNIKELRPKRQKIGKQSEKDLTPLTTTPLNEIEAPQNQLVNEKQIQTRYSKKNSNLNLKEDQILSSTVITREKRKRKNSKDSVLVVPRSPDEVVENEENEEKEVEEEQVEVEEEEKVVCICNNNVEIGFMVECTNCKIWQHCKCVGFKDETQIPEHYRCIFCKENEIRQKLGLGFLAEASEKILNESIQEEFSEDEEDFDDSDQYSDSDLDNENENDDFEQKNEQLTVENQKCLEPLEAHQTDLPFLNAAIELQSGTSSQSKKKTNGRNSQSSKEKSEKKEKSKKGKEKEKQIKRKDTTSSTSSQSEENLIQNDNQPSTQSTPRVKKDKMVRKVSGSLSTLETTKKEIEVLVRRLNLSASVCELAIDLGRQLWEGNGLKGVNLNAICGACVLIASRKEGFATTFKEICHVSQVPKKILGKCAKMILKTLNTSMDPITTDSFIARYCQLLRFDQELTKISIDVAKKACDIVGVAGRCPLSIAAASLYMVTLCVGFGDERKRIAELIGVAEVTIANSYRIMHNYRTELFPEHWFYRQMPLNAYYLPIS